MLFLATAISAQVLAYLACRKWFFALLSTGLFFLAASIRPEIGADYTTYNSIYYGEPGVFSGSPLFDFILNAANLISFPYRLLCLFPLCVCLCTLFWIPNSSLRRFLFPIASSYCFFNLLSVNITKSSLAISLLIGVAAPLLFLWISDAGRLTFMKDKRSLILLSLFALAFFIHPAITTFSILFVFSCFLAKSLIAPTASLILKLRLDPKIFLRSSLSVLAGILLGIQVVFTSRFSYYFDSATASVYTDVASFWSHAFPFMIFFILIISGFFTPLIMASSFKSLHFIARIYYSLPFLAVFAFYLLLGMSGANPNIIGRTSILYSLLSVFFLFVSFADKLFMYLVSCNLRALCLVLVLTLPNLYRAFSSYGYALALR